MSAVADIVVPDDAFVLPDAVGAAQGRITVERTVALPDEGLAPYLRVADSDFAAFEEKLADDPTAGKFDVFSVTDDERHYRVEWTDLSDSVLPVISRADGAVTRAEFADRRWNLRIRFRDRQALSAFCDGCRRRFPVTLDRVFVTSTAGPSGEYALTTVQREALQTALRKGYFSVPRETTQQELADELGISSQSLSQRLRRGQRNLLLNTIAAEDRDE